MMLSKKSPSAEALAKLEIARGVLNGKSPRTRGAEKQQIALDWIYRWGWSSPKILDLATGGGRTGLAARLVKNKLLRATKTESGGSVKGIPIHLLTLTATGLDEAERHREDLIQYELDPYRIDQSKLRHDGLAQMATANRMLKESIIEFKTPKELAAKSSKDIKQPDVWWLDKNGQRIGVEIELSAKWDRKLDQFVSSCITSMSTMANTINKVDTIILVSDSKAIVKRYTEAFAPGGDYWIWDRNDRGFWSQTKKMSVPEWVKNRIICHLIDY
jgi:hypothetical protein